MGLEENKGVVRRHLQLISEGDSDGAASLFAERSTNHGREITRDDIRRTMEGLVALGERFEVQEMVAEGDWVACRVMVTGKHVSQPRVASGIHLLTEPDGRSYTYQHIHLFKVVDGLIVQHWANRDDLGAARQLGLELKPMKG